MTQLIVSIIPQTLRLDSLIGSGLGRFGSLSPEEHSNTQQQRQTVESFLQFLILKCLRLYFIKRASILLPRTFMFIIHVFCSIFFLALSLTFKKYRGEEGQGRCETSFLFIKFF
jgi:hypothetical protein